MNQAKLSFWERESFFKNLDVAIIGSGIVGLNAVLHLKEKYPKLHIAIFEKGAIPTGASTRNAGFACFGSISELVDDLGSQSEEEVFALVEKRWRGLQKLKATVGEKNLQLKNHGGYELFLEHEEKAYQSYCDQFDYFNRYLADIIGNKKIFSSTDEKIEAFGFQKVKHLIYNSAEGQINTGAMMKSLLTKVQSLSIPIYNGIAVEHLEASASGVQLQMNNGWEIHTDKVLVATNGFVHKLLDGLEVQPARNQVLITKPIPKLKIEGTFHYDKGYYYFRNFENRVLFGGARNLDLENEMTDQFGVSPKIQNALEDMLREVILPDTVFEIDSWWSGILGVGATKKPIVERIHDRVVIAVRLGGMGVAIGSLVGEEGANTLINS